MYILRVASLRQKNVSYKRESHSFCLAHLLVQSCLVANIKNIFKLDINSKPAKTQCATLNLMLKILLSIKIFGTMYLSSSDLKSLFCFYNRSPFHFLGQTSLNLTLIQRTIRTHKNSLEPLHFQTQLSSICQKLFSNSRAVQQQPTVIFTGRLICVFFFLPKRSRQDTSQTSIRGQDNVILIIKSYVMRFRKLTKRCIFVALLTIFAESMPHFL